MIQNSPAFLENPGSPFQKTKQEISKRVSQKQESEILDNQEFRKNHDFLEYLKIQKEKSTKTKRRTFSKKL